MKRTAVATSLFFLLLSFRPLPAEEGMFLPDQLPPEALARMKALGCTLSAKDIYSPAGSLAQAVVSLGGGTGSFVSPQGLILTNHHVAFGAAQRQSSLKANLIRDGYLATTREDEIPAPGYKAWVLKEIREVTADVLKGVTTRTPPAKRTEKVERNIKALVEKYEGPGKDYSVRIASFHGGLSYYLFKSLLLRDLRIVYIPSRNIGEFGGETDNWIWPRHTGDFSFLRAYVGRDGHPADFARENVPYVPEKFLPISARDIDEGDFALLMGFPGRTSRYLTTEEIRFLVERDYPERIRLTKAFIDILEEEAQKDPEAAIKVAGTLKGLYNGYKNSQGKLEGFLRAGIVARRDAEQRALLSSVEKDPASARKYGPAIRDLIALIGESQRQAQKNMVQGMLRRSGNLLGFALQFNQLTLERTKKDLERKPGFQERDLPDVKARLELAQRSLCLPAEKKAFGFFLGQALALPEGQKIATFERAIEDKTPAGIAKFVDDLYDRSRLADPQYRQKCFDMDRQQLLAEKDPFVELAVAFQGELDAAEQEARVLEGQAMFLRPLFVEAIFKSREGPVFPDANATLRLNYGVLKGYSPRDAVTYSPQTTLRGVVEKDTGKEPFNVPEKIKAAFRGGDLGSYVDPELRDVPVNFLTTNDSTGGNSGSPILDKDGNLMGLLFDGNYESVVADFYFLPDITRTISVDARYILFVASMIDHADNLRKELTIVE